MKHFKNAHHQKIWLTVMIMFSFVWANNTFAAWETRTDRPGMDYKNFWIDNSVEGFVAVKQCADACKNDLKCKAYTYVNPGVQGTDSRCWLKNGVPAKVTKDGCTSEVVRPVSKGDYCNNYALTAVQMAKSNSGWKCGYSGNRWSLDHKLHHNWCMRVSKNSAESEARSRKEGMAQCMKPSTKGDLAAHDWCYRLDTMNGNLSFYPVIKNEKTTTWKSAKEGTYRVGVNTGSLFTEYRYNFHSFPYWYLNSKDISVLQGPTVDYHPDNMYGIKNIWVFSHPEDSSIDNNSSSEGLEGYFKGLSFENDPLLLVNQCHNFESFDSLKKPGNANELDVQIILRSIKVEDEADGDGNAEPYLWPFFFQIDHHMIHPDYFYNPKKWSHAPGGEHGNIGKEYDTGQVRLIPAKYGHWKTTLEQNLLYPKDNVYVGFIVVLLEEDGQPPSSDITNTYYPTYQNIIIEKIQCNFLKSMREYVDLLTAQGDNKAGLVKRIYDHLSQDPRAQDLDCLSRGLSSGRNSGTGAQGFDDFAVEAEKQLQERILENLTEPWWIDVLNFVVPGITGFVDVDDFIGGKIMIFRWTDLEKDPYRSMLIKWNDETGSEDGDFNLRVHLRAKPIY